MEEKLKALLEYLDAEGVLVFVFERNDKLSLSSYGKAFDGKLDLASIAEGAKRGIDALLQIASILLGSHGSITPPASKPN
jgi:hypothetical protein